MWRRRRARPGNFGGLIGRLGEWQWLRSLTSRNPKVFWFSGRAFSILQWQSLFGPAFVQKPSNLICAFGEYSFSIAAHHGDCSSGKFPASRISQYTMFGLASGYWIHGVFFVRQKTKPSVRPRLRGPHPRKKHGLITWTQTGLEMASDSVRLGDGATITRLNT
jgi:hypothetical protein